MATMNKFPPDVPKNWDEAADEVDNATDSLRSKASDMAGKATETVKDGYYRAKDAMSEMDPMTTAREGGEAVVRAVERHPLMAFGLGALSVGLIAWASLRPQPPRWSWDRYEPDYGRLKSLFGAHASEAQKSGEGLLSSGRQWLNSHSGEARDYADQGSRMIAHRAQNEPVAALLGVGLAIYVLGSLLSSSSQSASERRRDSARR